jgi:uncharacterized protein with GYD domain
VPKSMIKVSYGSEGVRGLIKEGGSQRIAAIKQLIDSLGGRLEAFYFAYGEDDAYVIADLPDAATGIAITLAVNASGAVRITTIPLITPAEMDAACRQAVPYRAPGA